MRRRRAAVVGLGFVAFVLLVSLSPLMMQGFLAQTFGPLFDRFSATDELKESDTLTMLDALEMKGRAPKTGYARTEFGNGWGKVQGCSVREVILYRDMTDVVMKNECQVQSGVLDDPYTGETLHFDRSNAAAVQIDHVVALSDAWQKGAQKLSYERRVELANDPLNLLASDGPANQQKGDSDAASWLPSNKTFRCAYIERQVAVKYKYSLWVTEAEGDAMRGVLGRC